MTPRVTHDSTIKDGWNSLIIDPDHVRCYTYFTHGMIWFTTMHIGPPGSIHVLRMCMHRLSGFILAKLPVSGPMSQYQSDGPCTKQCLHHIVLPNLYQSSLPLHPHPPLFSTSQPQPLWASIKIQNVGYIPLLPLPNPHLHNLIRDSTHKIYL